jgi:glycosyltransferase involved in cell wall biosynthesis
MPCRFVALGSPTESEDPPLILTDLSCMRNASWWKRWPADAVLLYSWAAPRYEPVARAIREAGCKLVVRLDSDGIFHPKCGFWQFVSRQYGTFKDQHARLPLLLALAKSILFRIRPQIYDRGFIRHLRHANAVVTESTISLQRYRSYLLKLGEAELAAKLRVLPHPTEDSFSYDPRVSKEERIVAVGRWHSWQKDAPKLVKCLAEVLRREPGHHANVYGLGDDIVRKLVSRLPLSIRTRIEISGPVPPVVLLSAYRCSQIIFVPSRYESFHIATAEALCCGASAVGPPALPSFIDFVGAQSGTLSTTRSVADLVDATSAEIRAWQEKRRDPEKISRFWRDAVSATSVGRTLIESYETL